MCRVLVVDDDSQVHELLNLALDDHEVRHAGGLEDAREVLKSYSPSVAILDLDLLNGDGSALLESGDLTGVSVVVLSGKHHSRKDRIDLISKGALYVVDKPFDLVELATLVKRAEQPQNSECLTVRNPTRVNRMLDEALSLLCPRSA